MEQRNMILAFALSMVVLLGWQMLFPQSDAKNDAVNSEQLSDVAAPSHSNEPPAPPVDTSARVSTADIHSPAVSSTKMPAQEQKMVRLGSISNDLIHVGISTQGALMTTTTAQYRESIKPGAAPVSILKQADMDTMYLNSGIMGQKIPVFHQVDKSDSSASSIHLQADLPDGRIWQRQFHLKPNSYVVEQEDRIINGAGLEAYYQVVVRNPNREKSRMYQFKGPIALIQDKLKEIEYDDLDEDGAQQMSSQGGWVGITGRFFIATILGDVKQPYRYYFTGDGTTYQAGLLSKGQVDGSDAVYRMRMYIGPKSTPVMKTLNAGLERAVDFGWFAFIAKPMHELLLFFHAHIPNFGWCIILLVVLIKLLFFWPTKKSYESMASMRKLQPEIKRLKDLYGDDRQKMGQETMGLYKKHKVNPLGGCLPIVIQIPVFFALYKVLLMSIEMRQAPFIGWIHDLSVMDPFYVLPVLMGLSMLVQQRLNPAPPDPMQAKIMQFLPIIFTVMFLFFPSGLVLYWLVNNVLSISQQWYVMKVQKAL